MATPIAIDDRSLAAAPWKSPPVCVIEFWSFRDEACRLVAPITHALAEVSKAPVFKVNVDDAPRIAAAFAVALVPSLNVLRGGRLVATFLESWSLQQVAAAIDAR